MTQQKMTCPDCGKILDEYSSAYCDECTDYFCLECYDDRHSEHDD